MADFAMKKGSPDYIMPTMDETEVFAKEAADVATVAIKAGGAHRAGVDWSTSDAAGHQKRARRSTC